MSILGDRVRELLYEHDISQKEFAKIIGVTEVTISRYISGERIPRVDTVDKMAKALNTNIEYLIGNTDIKNCDQIIYNKDLKDRYNIIDNTEKTEDQELVEDMIQIITVFSAKLQGKRAHKAKKIIEELTNDD